MQKKYFYQASPENRSYWFHWRTQFLSCITLCIPLPWKDSQGIQISGSSKAIHVFKNSCLTVWNNTKKTLRKNIETKEFTTKRSKMAWEIFKDIYIQVHAQLESGLLSESENKSNDSLPGVNVPRLKLSPPHRCGPLLRWNDPADRGEWTTLHRSRNLKQTNTLSYSTYSLQHLYTYFWNILLYFA